MNILGISCYYHDSAAAILRNGKIMAAAQEERFTRRKHDPDFPIHAIEYCLREAGISRHEIDVVAFYDKPFLKFERILETYLAYAPKGIRSALKALAVWTKEKLWISDRLHQEFGDKPDYILPEHHESHAASAFYASPFAESAILTMDGVGEWATSSIGYGNGSELKLLKTLNFPHSLGLLYSAFTYFTGFKVNSGEYKLMGLAPYGKAKYTDLIYENLLDLKADGSFRMNMGYFDYCAGLTMTNQRFNQLFGGKPRTPESKITQREMDLAASVQVVTEDIVLKMASHAKEITGSEHLCLAGGVALNCVANGKLDRSGIFKKIWVQPASGDAGGALGAALIAHYKVKGHKRDSSSQKDHMYGAYLGPAFSDEEIQRILNKNEAVFHTLCDEKLFPAVAEALASENVVGWFQGRMEFGPRALGNRSILGDPRSAKMQKNLNVKIKFRESFRPFAPSVLAEHAEEYFDLENSESPYMLLVAKVSKKHLKRNEGSASGMDKLYQIRSTLPAITHVDNSARVQTVHAESNPRYARLIQAFYEKTGCPVLINTSFNVRGEPIVCTPQEAYQCFMRTNMDVLVLGNHILHKKEQPKWTEHQDWREEYGLD